MVWRKQCLMAMNDKDLGSPCHAVLTSRLLGKSQCTWTLFVKEEDVFLWVWVLQEEETKMELQVQEVCWGKPCWRIKGRKSRHEAGRAFRSQGRDLMLVKEEGEGRRCSSEKVTAAEQRPSYWGVCQAGAPLAASLTGSSGEGSPSSAASRGCVWLTSPLPTHSNGDGSELCMDSWLPWIYTCGIFKKEVKNCATLVIPGEKDLIARAQEWDCADFSPHSLSHHLNFFLF